MAKKYTSAIGQLFEFIFENSDIQNISFKNELGAPSSRKKSYIGQCMDFINNCDELLDTEPNEALNDENADILLDWCDCQINKMKKDTKLITEIEFKRGVAGLCIKLMLLTGITYRDARMLKVKYLNTNLNTLIINDYRIRLPLILSDQFRVYEKIYENKLFDLEKGFLFVDLSGKQWGEKTTASGIPNFLKTEIGITSITSVIKYGIKQLMLQDVNDGVILKLTGASTSILKDCLPKENDGELDWYTYINSKVLMSKLYNRM